MAAKTAEVMMGHMRQFFSTDTSRVVCEVEAMRVALDKVVQGVSGKEGAHAGQIINVVNAVKGCSTAQQSLKQSLDDAISKMLEGGLETLTFRENVKGIFMKIEKRFQALEAAAENSASVLGRIEKKVDGLVTNVAASRSSALVRAYAKLLCSFAYAGHKRLCNYRKA